MQGFVTVLDSCRNGIDRTDIRALLADAVADLDSKDKGIIYEYLSFCPC